MQSATSRTTVSFQSDKLVYYASVFVYEPAQKTKFINYQASLHSFESKLEADYGCPDIEKWIV